MTKSHVKIILSLTVFLLTLSLVSPVFAGAPPRGGAHLWFYSQDPDTIPAPAPQPLPNPQDWDPNWSGSGDPFGSPEGSTVGFATSFTIWLGCAQFESLGTQLVVSINKVAFAAIQTITVNTIPIGSWSTGMPTQLSPHGVFNSAEFHGYALVSLGDLYSPPGTPYKVAITVDITLKPAADATGAKIHFDAFGTAAGGGLMKNPYSHDLTVPEPATIFMALTPLGALGIYAYKRKKTK